ncbi:sigma-70 family RNA polymerase sigma factor [Streptomyces roseirectus]|uniref:Sigma-70 family RNA polymerase sigma factor n=1 Tax=Streptomyces roseirectus TaxID=2768066 RepID=A0A7H0IIH3_9ACTN|nr:sigma-70 family RNA polymerase sigma factor [Streptomyces roseirectus]QNP72589.1 sigma-70 family RNA polymerase sigma factor [Streptomyces roseirectus]
MTGSVDGGGRDVGGGGVGGGGREEFDAFFQRTYPQLRARALLLWWHREEAEDAVQEAYVELLRHWDRVSGYEAPEAWAYRVMTQRLNRARRRWFRAQALEVRPAPAAGVEETAEARQVLAALRTLPDRQRQVLVLHCLQGMPQQEIADLLEISRGGVAASLHKARGKLGRAMGLPVDELPGGGDSLMAGGVGARPVSVTPTPSGDPLSGVLRHMEVWLTAACGPDGSAESR